MSLPVDRSSRDRATFVNLKKQDDSTTELLASATHVSMYRFDSANGRWDRHNVEGPLFVYKRSQAPRFRMAITNRLSTTNPAFDITADFTLQLIEPYMIFRHQPSPSAEPVIYGCWFPNGEERGRVYALLERLIASQANLYPSDSVIDQAQPAAPPSADPVGSGAAVAPPVSPSSSGLAAAGSAGAEHSSAPTSPRLAPPAAQPAKASNLLTPAMLLGEGNVATLTGVKAGTGGQQAGGSIDVETLRQALLELVGDDDFVMRLHSRLGEA